jgi:hypothetical protein
VDVAAGRRLKSRKPLRKAEIGKAALRKAEIWKAESRNRTGKAESLKKSRNLESRKQKWGEGRSLKSKV